MALAEMSILNEKGDTKITWDRNNADEVENARRTFTELMAKGHLAHNMTAGGPGSLMREFDPDAEALVMAPAMTAG